MTFAANPGARNGFDEFSINGVAFAMDRMKPLFNLALGRRYRLLMRNATDDAHPVHLHRHTFEISSIAGRPTSGVKKDVVMIGGFQEMSVDFRADQPGLSLFHCHMQHHMDFGFMGLLNTRYAGQGLAAATRVHHHPFFAVNQRCYRQPQTFIIFISLAFQIMFAVGTEKEHPGIIALDAHQPVGRDACEARIGDENVASRIANSLG